MDILQAADDKGIVQGLKDVSGVVPRQDIDFLLKNEPDTFNLFLIAMQELKDAPKWDHPMSYYQIAGIHGLPNGLWDKVDGKQVINEQTGPSSGYCAHSTETFPTWHRPYIAMMEQTVYKKMLEIAGKYTNPQRKTAYQEAVKKFRFPYWDYHRPRDYNATFPGITRPGGSTFYPYDFRVPQIFTLENIKVRNYPDDAPKQIPNPLHHFHFPTQSFSETDWKFSGLRPSAEMKSNTMRYPHNRQSRYDPLTAINGAINEYREESCRLSLLMVENGAYNNYEDYATNGVRVRDPLDGTVVSGSLESVHGNYHGLIGGLGHMSQVPTAAFDPIFWLHHCQIDRWFAIWQAAHPKGWFANQNLANQPLLPFRAPTKAGTKQGYWNSQQSIDTKSFGYTYPDLVGVENNPQEVQKRFRNHYGWARRLVKGTTNKPPPEMEPLDLSKSQFYDGIKEFKPLDKSAPQPSPMIMTMAMPPMEALAIQPKAAPQAVMKAAVPAAKPAAPVAPATGAASTSPATPASSAVDEKKVSREWYVDDVVERLALNNSFTILYFIGNFQADAPIDLLMEPAFAGLNHVFTSPTEICDNCGLAEQQHKLISSTSPITSMLLDYAETGELASLRPEHVKPFLVKKLKWRVVAIDGTTVNPRDLKGYQLSISCKVAPLPGEQGQTSYETYPEIIAQIIQNSS